MSKTKDTNPKDAVGVRKVPFTTIPWPVIGGIGLAMLEGARKYGRHNYRVSGVQASVYVDANARHMSAYWEGEDIDPDSGLHHVDKAIASLVVLRDAILNDMIKDDRPPSAKAGWQAELNDKASAIIDKYPDAVDPYTETGHGVLEQKERRETYDPEIARAVAGCVRDYMLSRVSPGHKISENRLVRVLLDEYAPAKLRFVNMTENIDKYLTILKLEQKYGAYVFWDCYEQVWRR